MTGAQQAADPAAAVMMTFAGLAYGQPSAIPGYLAQGPLAGGDWSIFWIGRDEVVPKNFAFIARSGQTGAYVVAIRGTYPNPFSPAYWENANQDNPLGPMAPWPYANAPEARVSGGTWKGFQGVLALTDGARSFEAAVRAIPEGSDVTVTGHSLGGTLAPVVALWISTLPSTLRPTVRAFAGMTPGNAAFATLFGEGTALAGRVWRINNTLDTVPYGWDRVLETRSFYQPAPRGGLAVEAALVAMDLALIGHGFTAIGQEVQLPGVLKHETISCEIIGYLLENLHQHLPDTYLALLGAPGLPFTIGFGAIVAPNDHPTVRPQGPGRMPVYFA